jgi:hypothetical protein
MVRLWSGDVAWLHRLTKRARFPSQGVPEAESLLRLDEALDALGRCPHQPRNLRHEQAEAVPVRSVVGTMGRADDFDRLFRPLNPDVRRRRQRLARSNDQASARLSPLSLIRVGELYFVDDGHHRISIAHARGQIAVDARVRAICTMAFACACLTQRDLRIKAAERGFLERVPLPDPALRDLWLDDPAGYETLAAAALTWSDEHGYTIDGSRALEPATAAAWWYDHVIPLAHTSGCAAPISTAATYLFCHTPTPS